jgi:hypothetical protein
VLDLKGRVAAAGRGGRAVVSVKWAGQSGELPLTLAPAGARD